MGRRVVLLDNRDSFTHNLAAYVLQLGVVCTVVDSHSTPPEALWALEPAGLILSPGPGRPEQAGCLMQVLAEAVAREVPVLGVCLGHQALGLHFGAQVQRAAEPMHGLPSRIRHDGTSRLYAGIPRVHRVGRYHSLHVVGLEGTALRPIAATTGPVQELMAMEHRSLPFYGVQYHPESLMTQHGHALLANFLGQCGLAPRLESAPPLFAPGAYQRWRRRALAQR